MTTRAAKQFDAVDLANDLWADFLASGSGDARKLACVLALNVGSSADVVRAVARRVWPELDVDTAWEDLGRWPFVRSGVLTALTERVQRIAADEFRRTDYEKFVDAHAAFAELEERAEADTYGDASWFVRGRLAYYLAVPQPADSSELFAEAFETAPVLDRTATRIWLGSLVERQADALGESRAPDFFRAFRHYVIGDYSSAEDLFTRVLMHERFDSYQAIAKHLLGKIRFANADPGDDKAGKEAISLIGESVAESMELGIVSNEVMARHSLIWALLSEHSESDYRRIEEAASLAETNWVVARKAKDRGLIPWCRRTRALTRWFGVLPVPSDSDAEWVLRELRISQELALGVEDFDTAALISNDVAGVLIEVGRFADAGDELAKGFDRVDRLDFPATIAKRLLKTTGRGRREAPPALKQTFTHLLELKGDDRSC